MKGAETGEEEIWEKESFDFLIFEANEGKRGSAFWVLGKVMKFGGEMASDGR